MGPSSSRVGGTLHSHLSINFLLTLKGVGIIGLPVKSPCLHPIFGPAFTPYPLFQWYPQSNHILLNLSMKCGNSALNAQG
jgi:hypothetical protein